VKCLHGVYMNKLTKSYIDKLAVPVSGQAFYRDPLFTGFAVRVTAQGAKSFILERRVNHKVKRITLGRYPDLTVEQARKEAQKLIGKIAIGIDPVAETKVNIQRASTLQDVFNDYLKARKNIKQSTIIDYKEALNNAVPDWWNKPMLSITKDMITKRHAKHGSERSQAGANLAMRILRALFNFAMNEYEDEKGKPLFLENPVKRLSHTRAWYRIERRQTMIKQHDLAKWYHAVQTFGHRYSEVQADMQRDYLLLVLFTGLRREEAARLEWKNVDLNAKTFTIVETKNHLTHTLPLSDFLHELFLRRQEHKTSDYVFSADSKAGYLNDPRKTIAKIIELSGVEFTIHDLRRTFITLAESLDIPVYALKKLLNHKTSSDVTAGYIIMDIERLRKPMQMITDTLLKLMRVKEMGSNDLV
jgi:integrase